MKSKYPGVVDAERERSKSVIPSETAPDFIGEKPNFDAFPNWDPADVLSWLNID